MPTHTDAGALLVALSPRSLSAKGSAAENLLRNGRFDARSRGVAGCPDFWALAGVPTLGDDPAEPGWGRRALRLEGAGAGAGIAQTTALKAATTYTVHARVKAAAGSAVTLATAGAGANASVSATAADWTTISASCTTGAAGSPVTISITAAAGHTAWCGAAWLTETASAASPTPGRGWLDISLPAGAWTLPTPAPARPGLAAGVNGELPCLLFSGIQEEAALAVLRLPDTLDPDAPVLFIATGTATGAPAAPNTDIRLTLAHSARAAGETWDAPYTELDTPVTPITAPGAYDQLVWQSPAGWPPGTPCRLRLSRPPAGPTQMPEDWALAHFTLRLPVSG